MSSINIVVCEHANMLVACCRSSTRSVSMLTSAAHQRRLNISVFPLFTVMGTRKTWPDGGARGSQSQPEGKGFVNTLMVLMVISPCLVHTLSRREGDLSWSYSRMGCCSRCTTAVYTGPGLDTGMQIHHKYTQLHLTCCSYRSSFVWCQHRLLLSPEHMQVNRQAERQTHCSTQTVSWSKVEATLLVHGILKPWQLRQSWPIMVKRVIPKTVVCAEETDREADRLILLI